MAISDKDVIAELTECGIKVEEYFLIGDDICSLNSSGEIALLLIEDLPGEKEGEMHTAALDFLMRRGAKRYESYEEFYKK